MKLNFTYDDKSGDFVAKYRGLIIKAVHCSDAANPRAEFDNCAVMACSHRRYNLGDSDGMDSARQAIRGSRFYRDTWESGSIAAPYDVKIKGTTYDVFDLSNPSDLWQAIQLCDDIASQPLYLFDHGGISISTGPFSCAWDSGQIGFAFITAETLKRESRFTLWTAAARQWASQMIDSETRLYDDYLTGQVYGYVIASDTDSHMESCWGYYGSDFEVSGLSESAIDAANFKLNAAHQKRMAYLAQLIRNRVPLDKRAALLAKV